MNKLKLFAVSLLFVSFGSIALSSEQVEKLDYCSSMSDLVEAVVEARNNGASKENMFNALVASGLSNEHGAMMLIEISYDVVSPNTAPIDAKIMAYKACLNVVNK